MCMASFGTCRQSEQKGGKVVADTSLLGKSVTESRSLIHCQGDLLYHIPLIRPFLYIVLPSTMSDPNSDPVIPEAKTLPDAPTDCISQLQFLNSPSSSSSMLVSTSWDGGLKLHDTVAMECKLSHTPEIGPLLSLAVVDEEYMFVGGLDGQILQINVANGGTPVVSKVGVHPPPRIVPPGTNPAPTASACSCLVAFPSSPPLLASAGWHGQFHLWDLRQSAASSSPAITMDLPGKAFTIDTHESRIVVGCSGRRTCVLDIRKSGETWTADAVLDAETSQKHQTRCMRFFPDGQSIAVGSVEGRVSVEAVATSTGGDAMKKLYAFKCHREGDLVYPVNAIEFHPKFGTFATGGCDGSVGTFRNIDLNVKALC